MDLGDLAGISIRPEIMWEERIGESVFIVFRRVELGAVLMMYFQI